MTSTSPKSIINCFLPCYQWEDCVQTIQELQSSSLIHKIYILTSDASVLPATNCNCEMLTIHQLFSTETMQLIASHANTPYTLFYTKTTELKIGWLALERMVQVMEMTQGGMVYADHYQQSSQGISHFPLIAYQQGSLRDDFNFGSLLLFRSSAWQEATAKMTNNYQAAGLYDLRLKISQHHSLEHINEYLYTEIEHDNRQSGEKQFDYVNPKNRQSQIEMEQACTDHLKCIDGFLPPFFQSVDFSANDFTYEASVIIPVRNRVRTIQDAIYSALNQKTNFPFNIIVVDNHSTDGTTEILQKLAQNPQVIHVIPERSDLGIGGCWNLGVHHPLCGKFAIQLDSDDIYKNEDSLQTMVHAFYEQQCAMVIGTYQMTDFQLNQIPPGIIDHKEWTPENGRNNALRINGLGAPRAFYTPLLRQFMLPNTSYGEDYAIGLRISREYQIGRVYDVVYRCRRWEGNSDAALSVEKVNRNNLYKDRIRTWELQQRIRINQAGGPIAHTAKQLLQEEKESWKTAYENYISLQENRKQTHLCSLPELNEGGPVEIFPNPKRIASTMARTQPQAIQERPCFLCSQNRPSEQKSVPFLRYELLVNPYPIFQSHLTIAAQAHEPQSIANRFMDFLQLCKALQTFYLLYNGPECGASAPDHAHFQAASKEESLPILQWCQQKKACKIKTNDYQLSTLSQPITAIILESTDENTMLRLFETMYPFLTMDTLSKEPRMNLLAWYNDNNTYHYHCVLILRSKHRPDCFFANGEEQILISPAIAEMCGIVPMVRIEDVRKLTPQRLQEIYQEVSLSTQTFDKIIQRILQQL